MHPTRTALTAVLVLSAVWPALAATPLVRDASDGAVIGPPEAPTRPGFVVKGGVTLEFSDDEYGRGTGPSLSAESYVEAEIDGFYIGIKGLVTDEKIDNQVDYYLGYRRELDTGFSYNIDYTRTSYPRDGGDCCGELELLLFAPVSDKLGLGLDLAYDPELKIGNYYVYGEYYISDKWTLSANYGLYEEVDADRQREWDFGAGYDLSDESALDFRWYDGTDQDGYMALALSFDTTILGE